MNAALAAHLRLLHSIPRDRIHTHVQPSLPQIPRPGRPRADVPQRRRAAIAQMLEQMNPKTGEKWSRAEMAAELGISKVAVRKHIRVLRGGTYRKRK